MGYKFSELRWSLMSGKKKRPPHGDLEESWMVQYWPQFLESWFNKHPGAEMLDELGEMVRSKCTRETASRKERGQKLREIPSRTLGTEELKVLKKLLEELKQRWGEMANAPEFRAQCAHISAVHREQSQQLEMLMDSQEKLREEVQALRADLAPPFFPGRYLWAAPPDARSGGYAMDVESRIVYRVRGSGRKGMRPCCLYRAFPVQGKHGVLYGEDVHNPSAPGITLPYSSILLVCSEVKLIKWNSRTCKFKDLPGRVEDQASLARACLSPTEKLRVIFEGYQGRDIAAQFLEWQRPREPDLLQDFGIKWWRGSRKVQRRLQSMRLLRDLEGEDEPLVTVGTPPCGCEVPSKKRRRVRS